LGSSSARSAKVAEFCGLNSSFLVKKTVGGAAAALCGFSLLFVYWCLFVFFMFVLVVGQRAK